MEDTKTTFGRRLRLIRKARGLTLEELGKAASLGFKHVAAIERGQKTPSFEAIDRLAAALKVSPYEMFLPYEASGPGLDRAFRQLMQDTERKGAAALKRFLLVALPLLEQGDGES